MKIYKYLNLEKKHNWENFELMILQNQYWFSNNTQLNDPCDGKPLLDFNISPEEYARRIINLKKIDDHKLTEFDRSMKESIKFINVDEIKENTRSNFINYIKPHYVDIFNQAARFVGILCFSKIPNDPLLWSHYGNSHKGICVEFDVKLEKLTEELNNKFCIAKNVKYQSNRPRIKMSDIINKHGINFYFKQEIMHEMFFIKGLSWKQEQEFRVSKINEFEGGNWTGNHVSIETIKPESVIFGLNTSVENINRVATLANIAKIETKKVGYSEHSFFLDIFSISDMDVLRWDSERH